MRIIIAIVFFLLLFPIKFLPNPIIGGDSQAFAAEAYPERDIFEITIENNASKVRTVMTVYADSEQAAHDQVALNGWSVVGVKRIKGRDSRQFDLDESGLKDNGGGISVSSSMDENKPVNDSSIRPNKSGGGSGLFPSSPQGIIADGNGGISDNSGNGDGGGKGSDGKGNGVKEGLYPDASADNLNLLPDSPDLELLITYFFNLGIIEPIRDHVADGRLVSLDKNGRYAVFGYADEVPVGSGASYGSNYELSYKRANFIKSIMIRAGIAGDNIRTVGLGTNFKPEYHKPGGTPELRRVEVYAFRRK